MKFLSHVRSKSKLNSNKESHTYHTGICNSFPPVTLSLPRQAVHLPIDILQRILAFVCPHTQDESYVTSEDSMTDGGCMLCDMRDLAQCALVGRSWGEAAALLLYVTYISQGHAIADSSSAADITACVSMLCIIATGRWNWE
jgi:hypothetical protein